MSACVPPGELPHTSNSAENSNESNETCLYFEERREMKDSNEIDCSEITSVIKENDNHELVVNSEKEISKEDGYEHKLSNQSNGSHMIDVKHDDRSPEDSLFLQSQPVEKIAGTSNEDVHLVSEEVVGTESPLSSSVPSPSSSSSLVSLDMEKKDGRVGEVNELRKLCMHLQSVLDQQLKERERLQQKNEDLSYQLRSLQDVQHTNQQTQQNLKQSDVSETISKQPSEVSSLKRELEATKLILQNQEAKFTKEISSMKSSYTSKIESLTRWFEECKKEKDSMVIRYAQAESKNIELLESCKRAELKVKEWTKERDAAVSKWNILKTENAKALKLIEMKDNELASLKKECDSQRESCSSKDLQIKFLHQKVRTEQELAKEARDKIQDRMEQIASERTDCECLLNEFKALNQANQMLQLTGSLPTLSQIMNRIELVIKKKEESTTKELWVEIFENLHLIVSVVNNLMIENVSLKDKSKRVHQELASNEENLLRNQKNYEELENEKDEIGKKFEEMQLGYQKMELEMKALKELNDRSIELERINEELQAEMEIQSQRHAECLEYTNKMSQIYASLQAENIMILSELSTIKEEKEVLQKMCKDLEVENNQLIEQRLVGLKDLEEKVTNLESRLDTKTAQYNMLTIQFNDVEDEFKSLKRQSAAKIKDLTRQLYQLNRQKNIFPHIPPPSSLDPMEDDSSSSSNISDHCTPCHNSEENHKVLTTRCDNEHQQRNSFVSSGKKVRNTRISFHDSLGYSSKASKLSPVKSRSQDDATENTNDQRYKICAENSEVLCDGRQNQEGAEVSYLSPPSVRVVEVNKQMLIDKIVSLQKNLAKKNERMDFLQELNLRLTHDVASKAKIIQNYILREETGVMSTNQSDKLKMSKRVGIMASLFSSQPQDEAMTVDLALEICHKLQSVLEDTLLKNIAFKESIELLGQQVAKLSKENGELREKQPAS